MRLIKTIRTYKIVRCLKGAIPFLVIGLIFVIVLFLALKKKAMISEESACILISALIVAAGWFATGYINNKNNLKKEIRGCRIETLKNILTAMSTYIELAKLQKKKGWDKTLISDTEKMLLNLCRDLFYDINFFFEGEDRRFLTGVLENIINSVSNPQNKKMNIPYIAVNRIRKELNLRELKSGELKIDFSK